MLFTNMKMDPAAVAASLTAFQRNFAASGAAGTFEQSALRVVGARMRDKPQLYVEFGPYWWAVKQALNDAGAALGDAGDPLVAAEYRGASVAETLVAAEAFKDHYRRTYFVGHNTFALDDSGESYELADPDMQARIKAAGMRA